MVKVLLVDDEADGVNSLRAVMESAAKFPISFHTATSEAEAAQVLANNTIDVVVTDLVMTGERGGIEVLKAARAKDPLTMVILLTAYEEKLDRYEAFELGAFDCVPKNAVGVNPGLEALVKVKGASEFRNLALRQVNYEKTKASLSRYFDPEIFALVENQPDLLEPCNKTITVCFWDIRGFSALSESLKAYPTLITGFLEDYFDLMSRTIFKYSGVLDKFIGDGTMALFGSTSLNASENDITNHACAALKASLEIHPEFEQLIATWQDRWGLYTPQRVPIGLGCGVHTGDALVGRIGKGVRDQFTALGPSVNFAARLCSKAAAGQTLVSTGTQLRCRETFVMEDAGVLDDIKNIAGRFPVYNVTRPIRLV